jgi:hypothetical protein
MKHEKKQPQTPERKHYDPQADKSKQKAGTENFRSDKKDIDAERHPEEQIVDPKVHTKKVSGNFNNRPEKN